MPRPKKRQNKEDLEDHAEETKDSSVKKVSFKEEEPLPQQRSQSASDEATSEESEDEDAVLLTGKVENKIFETLLSIKNKDPEIYDPDHKIFYDSDFEADEDEAAKRHKPVTYKEMVTETLLNKGADALESDEEDGNLKRGGHRTYQEEQEDLKKAFLSAAEMIDGETDFFKKSSEVDTLPESKMRQKSHIAKQMGDSGDGIISRYWESGKASMDADEEFLKDYILNQRWREDKPVKEDYKTRIRLDEEDEEHLEQADEFEYKYNYRFEEEGGTKIVGHPRNIEDSVRMVEERRKKKRKEKKEQKQEEKLRREQELKRLKNIKKAEIEKKIREIGATAGVELNTDAIDLNAPFDPVQHEKDMKKILGSDYHKMEDAEWNPAEEPGDDDNELWWLCDNCQKGIPVGHKHFDCLECDNYSLCESCLPLADHEHSRMKAQVVPPNCAPPAAAEEEIAKMVDDYYKLDYEDIGGMKVGFKYRKVEPYKCSLQTILEKSDRELNALMPLSKLLTHDTELPKHYRKKGHQKKSVAGKLSEDKRSMDRRMTKYNVNRDRLQAFGLKEKQVKKKNTGTHKPE